MTTFCGLGLQEYVAPDMIIAYQSTIKDSESLGSFKREPLNTASHQASQACTLMPADGGGAPARTCSNTGSREGAVPKRATEVEPTTH